MAVHSKLRFPKKKELWGKFSECKWGASTSTSKRLQFTVRHIQTCTSSLYVSIMFTCWAGVSSWIGTLHGLNFSTLSLLVYYHVITTTVPRVWMGKVLTSRITVWVPRWLLLIFKTVQVCLHTSIVLKKSKCFLCFFIHVQILRPKKSRFFIVVLHFKHIVDQKFLLKKFNKIK